VITAALIVGGALGFLAAHCILVHALVRRARGICRQCGAASDVHLGDVELCDYCEGPCYGDAHGKPL